MRILFLGSNWLGWQVLQWLREREEEIVGVVMHPESRRKFGNEILDIAHDILVPVFDGSQLRLERVLEEIEALKPDIGLSMFFGHILEPGDRPEFAHRISILRSMASVIRSRTLSTGILASTSPKNPNTSRRSACSRVRPRLVR